MPKRSLQPLNIQTNLKLPSWQACVPLITLILLVWAYAAVAQPSDPSISLDALKADIKQELQVGLDTLWVVFAACLVFFMNAGFAMLETGFCRQKNAVSILTKNLIVFALVSLAFWTCGFGLMFSDGNSILGTSGFFLTGADNSPLIGKAYQGVFDSLSWVGIPLKAKFFFQLAFAGTAATIVSGAVAERIKFFAFVFFSFLLVAIAYPLIGHWIWGGGWLSQLGFWDFAGSTVVHSVGGWAALVGTILLGPRIGKFKNGQPVALPGHNFSLATLGCLILWLGWFGFNPGSTMAADAPIIAHILLTTNMAAATGGVAATFTSRWHFGNPDLSMIINGILAGLVGVTAACRYVGVGWAGVIGLVAGVMVVFSVDYLERLNIDDPVGAISVHLLAGVWGTLAVALFAVGPNVNLTPDFILYGEGPTRGLLLGGGVAALRQLLVQLLGVFSVSLFMLMFSWFTWTLIKTIVGLRVLPNSELKGLDISEHGLRAYSDFLVKKDPSLDPNAALPKQLPPF